MISEIVLKGIDLLIGYPVKKVLINFSGNSGIVSSGSGDLAVKQIGDNRLNAGDIKEFLPAAIKSIRDNSEKISPFFINNFRDITYHLNAEKKQRRQKL